MSTTKPNPPARCPGHTCDFGRTQDWIAGQGSIDGKYFHLPPGHFWYDGGGYLAHADDADDTPSGAQ